MIAETLKPGDQFRKLHICQTCGKAHNILPKDSRIQFSYLGTQPEGYYWECDCGSTMFVFIKERES